MNSLLYSSKSASYLLELNLETDSPIPVYKTITQIFEENLYWFLMPILTITLAFIVWRFIKKKKLNLEEKEVALPVDPFEEAIRSISELQNEKIGDPKPFVFRLSEILRVYVERLFKLPAMELTGEEFMREIATHSFFKNRYESTLMDFIEQGDRIKYSKEEFSLTITEQLLELALHFVKDTHAKLLEERQNSSSSNSKEA